MSDNLCGRCGETPSTLRCSECKILVCEECDALIHGKGKWKAHERTKLSTNNDSIDSFPEKSVPSFSNPPLQTDEDSNNPPLPPCETCLEESSVLECIECKQSFCLECNLTLHIKGWRNHNRSYIKDGSPYVPPDDNKKSQPEQQLKPSQTKQQIPLKKMNSAFGTQIKPTASGTQIKPTASQNGQPLMKKPTTSPPLKNLKNTGPNKNAVLSSSYPLKNQVIGRNQSSSSLNPNNNRAAFLKPAIGRVNFKNTSTNTNIKPQSSDVSQLAARVNVANLSQKLKGVGLKPQFPRSPSKLGRSNSAALTSKEVLQLQEQGALPNPWTQKILDFEGKFNLSDLQNLEENKNEYTSHLKSLFEGQDEKELSKNLSLVPKENLIQLLSILCYTIHRK